MDELAAPSLVIAMPSLRDPNFHRSVVLLIEHGAEGSFGLTVNRPSPVSVGDLCENLGVPWGGPDDVEAGIGGPVAGAQGFLLHGPVADDVVTNSREVAPGIHLALDMETFRALCERPPGEFRMMLGYAGWGAGQLEAEVRAGSWLFTEPETDLVFATPADEVWDSALRHLGIDPAMLVTGTGVH